MKQPGIFFGIILSVIILSLSCLQAEGASKEKFKQSKDRSLKILTLGDSNGALPFGWVNQLRQIRNRDTIFNISISGNTIGFNNNGRASLNTLANIREHMHKAYAGLGNIDRIIIMLGTNDCKAVFSDSLQFVAGNMKNMIAEIKKIAREHKNKPVIYIVSPPPFGPDEMLEEKYKGGLARVADLNLQLEKLATEESVVFINTFGILAPVFKQLTADGVHLNAEGQKMIALIIQENLKHQDRVSR
jgi:lysophospholipase L1-like esterase